MLPLPFYDHQGITLYCGDSREIIPLLLPMDCVITDPVWPNATADIPGKEDPIGLLREVARHFPPIVKRVVIQLGCDSDPRFLSALPPELPFLRTCWLEYVRPHYKGRLLYTSDVAYVYGEWPPSQKGAHVLSGRYIQTDAAKKPKGHPCPRQLQHVKWLIRQFARGPILEPFSGSGTTLLAAKQAGYPAVGIEIEERYCELAVERLQQDVLPWGFEEAA